MKVLIVEDEIPAIARMESMLLKSGYEIEIAGRCRSIKETVQWIKNNPDPDLIFLDIQLTDGLSLKIFESVEVLSPVIFTTAYDDYILDAFNHNAIDYLLKPIRNEKLNSAIKKYILLGRHFNKDFSAILQQLAKVKDNYKQRFSVKSGSDFFTVPVNDIAYFYTEHKIIFLVTPNNKKYIIDKNLSELEKDLNPEKFFRLNRKFIANIAHIIKYNSSLNGKLLVFLSPEVKEQVIVSQEKAAEFKKWMDN